MIVTIKLPAAAEGVKYGKATMLAADDHTLDVPAYVAKSLLALDGVTGGAQPDDVGKLLASVEADFELNYFFHAHGRPIPVDKVEPIMVEQPVVTAQPVMEEQHDEKTGEKFEVITRRTTPVETGEVEMVPTGEMQLVEAVDLKALADDLLAQRGEPAVALI